MKEYEVALEKVLPFLRDQLGWPEELISSYGRTPVQVGATTVWADYVCCMSQGQKLVPWLLVEVKQAGVGLEEEAIPQAESYSLILNSPFFCVTDGDVFKFFVTGSSQGKSIRIESLPPKPSSEFLKGDIKDIFFPPHLDTLVDSFILGLKNENRFRGDTEWHDDATKRLYQRVFSRIDSISARELKDSFDENLMLKPPNKRQLFRQIDEDFDKFRKVLKFIRDFKGDAVVNISKLLDRKGDLHLERGGIFFVTQLLAGAHPNAYVVLEENVSRSLRFLKVTEILVKNDTVNGYMYVNEICKKLHKEKMKLKLHNNGFDFGLAAVHNFLWHYYVHYRKEGKWFPLKERGAHVQIAAGRRPSPIFRGNRSVPGVGGQ